MKAFINVNAKENNLKNNADNSNGASSNSVAVNSLKSQPFATPSNYFKLFKLSSTNLLITTIYYFKKRKYWRNIK